ncbi:NFX1-type zinc finger-containing protein 1 [Holothuria leucospilota]|uniref:NFX1-type zinc finger-containing protein 1 n=1 Tax=Holothuria leucospilota TaxID=206669 RepID=A0A9Q1HAM3_HOLLE|nr:NFX1-type zinc finger-containing protein 1 [Holothuria leucospilota]
MTIEAKRKDLLEDITKEEEELNVPRELSSAFIALSLRSRRQKGLDEVAKSFLTTVRQQVTRCFSEAQMTSLEYKIEMYKRLGELRRKVKRISDQKGNNERKVYLEKIFLDTLHWLTGLSYVSDQNAEDWNFEVKRMTAFMKLMEARVRVSVTQTPPAGEAIRKIYFLLSEGVRYSEVKQNRVETLFRELGKYTSGLGVTKEEREMIVKAVGLAAGHWYKCRNGHIYAIGECGGAMERSKCPECNDTIGGQRHQLESSNRHAPEMDGSRFAAWSEAANMANFDPNEFR